MTRDLHGQSCSLHFRQEFFDMAADFFLGESLVGDGNEVAHIDLIIGSKSGPAGSAFCQRAREQQGRLHDSARGSGAEPSGQARHPALQQGHDQGRQAGGPDVRTCAGSGGSRRGRFGCQRRHSQGQGRRPVHPGGRVHPLGRERRSTRSTTTTTRRPRNRSPARSARSRRWTKSFRARRPRSIPYSPK